MRRNGNYLLVSWIAAGTLQVACDQTPLPTAVSPPPAAQVTTTTEEEAPFVVTTVPVNGGTLAFTDNIAVTFSEPVQVAGNWFRIWCTDGEEHSAAVSGGPTTFTLDPDADLPVTEGCTFTIFATGVTDQDTNDPPDNMDTDYQIEFIVTEAGAACTSPYTPAYVIQGSGPATPLPGSIVTTQGVVVGDYEGPSPTLRGFYLQDATGDGDPATSDAIFVFNGSNNTVAVGDLVRVTGTAQEFQDQTQVGSVTSVEVCSSGNTITPVDIALPVPTADYLERYEGMLVRFAQALHVTEHFQLGRFGQVVLSSGSRLLQPTAVVAPGAPALAMQAANNLNRILVDDDLNNQNPDPILFGRGGNPLSAVNTLRGGDVVTGLTGVLTYTWAGNAASGNTYRVRPVNALGGGVPSFVATNARPSSPGPVGGTLRVAALNLLNYFNTFSGCSSGVGGAPTNCRGAENAGEFDRQAAKTVAAIYALDADVVGLIELENDGYDAGSAVADLVSRLNAVAGAGAYAFIDADAATGQPNALGLDAIKVGLIYKPGSLTPVGNTAVLNTAGFVNGGDGELRNRASLAQAFQQPGGGRFIVNVNHLKSKGSACDAPDAGDGQGNCNAVRTNAVNELLRWLATDPTSTQEPDVLIVGDMNAYAKEDPISAFLAGGYTDLVASMGGGNPYSFVFDGQWGYLDHALASSTLLSQVAGVTEWHINADEPAVLDYNTNFKSAGQQTSLYSPDMFRMADHDPILVGLSLRAAAVNYTFAGFFQPVANTPAVNVMKPGRAVPVTFSLGGDRGLDVFETGYPKSVRVACDLSGGTNPIDLPAATATPGQSSLTYDARTDTYTYVWKTEGAWANTCRELIVRLRDETVHRAVFTFER